MNHLIRVLIFLTGLISLSNAENWPEGYIVYEKSVSPDKRFGILIPDLDKMEPDEDPGTLNHLADLKTRQLLGKIEKARYWDKGNHVGLDVRWAPDSSMCLSVYEGRFGFHSVSALLLDADRTTFRQLDLGEKIQNDLDRVISEKTKEPSGGCEALLIARLAGNKILFRALGTTNPKEAGDRESFHSSFYGIYDLKSGKWSGVRAESIGRARYVALGSALSKEDFDTSPEAEARYLDESLNEVYKEAGSSLGGWSFTQVRSEQIEWLKHRDSIRDLPEKNRFVEARIEALYHLIE